MKTISIFFVGLLLRLPSIASSQSPVDFWWDACSSHTNCTECSSLACHWCTHDSACHAKGSPPRSDASWGHRATRRHRRRRATITRRASSARRARGGVTGARATATGPATPWGQSTGAPPGSIATRSIAVRGSSRNRLRTAAERSPWSRSTAWGRWSRSCWGY